MTAGAQFADQLPEREPALRVESGGRLIEEEHARPVGDRAGDLHPLGQAAGESHRHRGRAVGQPELGQQFVGTGAGVGAGHAEVAAVVVQILADGAGPIEGVVLGDHADAALDRRGIRSHVDAIEGHPPAGGAYPGRADADRGGLSRAIRAQQGEDLAGANLQIHPPQGTYLRRPRVRLDERLDRERGRPGHGGRRLNLRPGRGGRHGRLPASAPRRRPAAPG